MDHEIAPEKFGTGRALSGFGFGICAALIWGGFPVIAKMGINNSLDPPAITAIRFLISGIVLLPTFVGAWPLIRRRLATDKHAVFWLAVICIGAGFPYIWLSVHALRNTPANHFGIIVPSTMMLFSLAGGRLLLKEQLGPNTYLAVGIVFIGLVLIGFESMSRASWLFSDLLFVGAGFLWAMYTIGSKIVDLKPLETISIVAVVSMMLYAPILFVNDSIRIENLSDIALQAIYQGILSAVVALLLYTRAVRILGASRGGLFGAIVPAATVLLASIFFWELPSFNQLVGALIVTAGIIVASMVRNSHRQWPSRPGTALPKI